MQLSPQFHSFNGPQSHHYLSISKLIPVQNPNDSSFPIPNENKKSETEKAQCDYASNLLSLRMNPPITAYEAQPKFTSTSCDRRSPENSQAPLESSNLCYNKWLDSFPGNSTTPLPPQNTGSCYSSGHQQINLINKKKPAIRPSFDGGMSDTLGYYPSRDIDRNPPCKLVPQVSASAVPKASSYCNFRRQDQVNAAYTFSVPKVSSDSSCSPQCCFTLNKQLAELRHSNWKYQLYDKEASQCQDVLPSSSRCWISMASSQSAKAVDPCGNLQSKVDNQVANAAGSQYAQLRCSSSPSCFSSSSSFSLTSSSLSEKNDYGSAHIPGRTTNDREVCQQQRDTIASHRFDSNGTANEGSLTCSTKKLRPHLSTLRSMDSSEGSDKDLVLDLENKLSAKGLKQVDLLANQVLHMSRDSRHHDNESEAPFKGNDSTEQPSGQDLSEKSTSLLATYLDKKDGLCSDPTTMANSVSIKIRAIISEWKVGTIIGRQGSSISDMRQKYRCKITVSSDTTLADRLLTVTGPWPRVACVIAKVCSILAGGGKDDHYGNKSSLCSYDKVKYPDHHVQPANPKTKTATTGVLSRATVKNSEKKSTSQNSVNGLGVADKNETRKSFSIPTDVAYPDVILSTMLSAFDGVKYEQLSTNMFSFVLSVPSSQCGCLIGKGGAQIREFRQRFCVSFSVASVSSSQASDERLINISGSPFNVAWCLVEVCRLFSISTAYFGGGNSMHTASRDPVTRTLPKSKTTAKLAISTTGIPPVPETKLPTRLPLTRKNVWKTRDGSVTEIDDSVIDNDNMSFNNVDVLSNKKAGCVNNVLKEHEQTVSGLLTKNDSTDTPRCVDDTSVSSSVKRMSLKPSNKFRLTRRTNLQAMGAKPRGTVGRPMADYTSRLNHSPLFMGTHNDELSPNVEEYSFTLPTGDIEVHLRVPNDIVGCIIGKGGKTISEIRNTSETFISITETVASPADAINSGSSRNVYPSRSGQQNPMGSQHCGTRQRNRVICIRGPINNVRTARFLMGSSILSAQRDAAQTHLASHNNPPRSTIPRSSGAGPMNATLQSPNKPPTK